MLTLSTGEVPNVCWCGSFQYVARVLRSQSRPLEDGKDGAAVMPEQSFVRRYGPWAVVTGASDGIGRAFAVELAGRGLNLVLVARRSELLDALGSELHACFGVECVVQAVDLADRTALRTLLDMLGSMPIGLLVAAAGFGSSGPLIETAFDDELEQVDLNCRAVLALCRHLAPGMVVRRSGGMILLSSIVAFQGVPGASNYAATKAYVQSLAEGLGGELAPHGIAVLACAPGPVASGFAARAGLRLGAAVESGTVARQALRALGRRALVRPGGLSKLLGWSLSLLPRVLRVRVMARVMAGMTAHR